MTRPPHTRAAHWPETVQGRFAHGIRTDSPEGASVALLGLPDDLGVRLNHGRPGARFGPAAFRAALARYGAGYDAQLRRDLGINVFDAGDVEPADGNSESALHQTHDRVTEATRWLHDQGLIVVGIGGGHDLTFAAVRGLAEQTGSAVRGVNVDPHLDVRESPGSGMAFRALIEGEHLDGERFGVIGAARFANSHEHMNFLLTRHAVITTIDEILSGRTSAYDAFRAIFPQENVVDGLAGFVSIDLDSLDSAHAPGVSALNPMGFEPRHVVEIAHLAGRHPSMRHFDIMELAPVLDEPNWDGGAPVAGRTARLAVLLFLSFLSGLQERLV